MAIGVITDIHGNSTALDAVLADAAGLAVHAWHVLGDVVAIGPDPVGVVDRLQALPNAMFVRGNAVTREGGSGAPLHPSPRPAAPACVAFGE